jgi:hypothetical protein
MIQKIILILISIQALSSQSAFGTESNYGEELCGDNPPTLYHQAQGSLINMEKDMPPIRNQGSTNWCYVFSSCDIMNYNLHMNQLKQNKNAKYSPQNEISFIDAAGLEQSYLDRNTTPPLAHPGRISYYSRGYAFQVLSALQDAEIVRSQKQMPFFSVDGDDSNPQKNSTADSIINAQNGFANSCPATTPTSTDVGFSWVNKSLAQLATKSSDLHDNNNDIDHYLSLAQKKTGPPTVTLPPFVPHAFYVNSATATLKQLKKVLQSKQPVAATVCTKRLLPSDDQSCKSTHVLMVVGYGYDERGKCSVRLRNSVGANWGDKGYLTMPVDQFVKAAHADDTFSLEWMEPSATSQKIAVETYDGPPSPGVVKTFTGTIENHHDLGGMFVNGTLQLNGKSYPVKNKQFIGLPAN